MLQTDICIAGAGVIGLSIALELTARNLSVIVVEAGDPFREASWAAAGMLAAHDPHNPAELSALSELSVSLYPQFLEHLQLFGGVAVPFQTSRTLQLTKALDKTHDIPLALGAGLLVSGTVPETSLTFGLQLLQEQSIDPRQLASSLLAAVAAAPIRLLVKAPVLSTRFLADTVQVTTCTGIIEAAHFIDCTGAWVKNPEYEVLPVKGQMLAVALPPKFPINTVVRTSDIYIVPRTLGPRAGNAIIGATVEDVGFDKGVYPGQLEDLRQQAITLLPELARAEVIDSWAGLRPAAKDRLPILGAHPHRRNQWIATGHYRNGILLAPATARVMTQLVLGEVSSTPLDDFAPSRSSLRKSISSELVV